MDLCLLIQDSLCWVCSAKCFVLWRRRLIFQGFHSFTILQVLDYLSVWAKSFFYLPDLMSSSRKFSKSSRPKWRMFKICLRSFLPWTGQGRKVLFSILAKDTKSCEWLLWFNDNIHILNLFMKSYIGSEEEKYEKNEELI